MIKVSIDHQVMQNVMSGVADQLKNKIDLNLNHVKKICKARYGIDTIAGVENKDANIVVFKDQIACKLDFEICFPMSILITTKENSNRTLPKNSDIRAEIDAIPEELDDLSAYVDNTPKSLEEIAAELDDLMAEEHDDIPEAINDMDRSKKQSKSNL